MLQSLSDDHGECGLPCIICTGDGAGAGGRTKPVKSVVYTNTPKLAPDASSHAAILPAKSTSEDAKIAKSTSAEDTKPATPAGKAATKPATKPAKAANGPTDKVDIETHGRAAGQSTTMVDIRSPEHPQEYIPAVRTAFKSASPSAKQSTTSGTAGKQPLASNTEVRVNFQG